VIKSDYQAGRDDLLQKAREYVPSTNDIWSTSVWSDSDLRSYLISNGWIKSDSKAKRDELVKTAQKHGNELAETAKVSCATCCSAELSSDSLPLQDYYNWSDKRLQGYLRSTGIDSSKMPKTREGLMREMRARYHRNHTGFFAAVKDGVRSILGVGEAAAGAAEQKANVASVSASSAASVASASASSAAAKARDEL